MDKTITFRVGQLNLQGSKVATTELPVIAGELGLDLVLVQEQHQHPRVLGCGTNPKAGLLPVSSRFIVTLLHDLCNEHCAVGHVSCQSLSIYVVSLYCQYSHDISLHLQHLTHVMDQLSGHPILIGVDSNAHSPMWHCERRQWAGRGPDTEYRKSQMEGFILGRNLLVHNVEGQPPTFHSPNGSSNVDITISTRSVRVADWKVHEGVSVSDHQLITFGVILGDSRMYDGTEFSDNGCYFRERGVNWGGFCSTLHARMSQLRLTRPANEICEQYSAILLRTARERLGTRAKKEKEGYEWWSPALDRMRNEVYCARRKWQASRRAGGDREKALHDQLRAVRIRYKLAMKDAEIAFFRSVAESGNTDPWGLAYRTASGRFRPPLNVLSGMELADGYTRTTGDTMLGLVNALCPDDNLARDTEYHRQVRIAAACAPSGTDAAPPTKEQVGLIIRELPNTAPGIDGITAKIVRQAWRVTGDEIWHMFRACIVEGVFPNLWKMGKLVVLPKGGDRPLTDPKAYRPITLLPVMGKILERVIISCAPCLYRGISDAQHGFTRGRSTVTALNTINRIASGSAENYVQLIFLDISGAFDNAWWPMVLLKAKQCGVPPNIYRILTSYFINRRVGLFAGNRVVWKVSTMGCPQGSVLGPTLWNLLLDDLLKLPKPEGVHFVAYADDVTIVIEASSRSAIERKAAAMTAAVSEWGVRNRLGFSAGKSQTMTYKGKFKRGPIIKMDGATITSVSQAKVLGIVLDEARSYVQHALYIGEKAAACFGKMSRLSSSTWGIRFHALRVLYSGTYVAILTYAAAVWYRRSSLYVIRSVLMRTQRSALILLTKAYRTASNAALPVLAGVLPADLEVLRAGRVDEEGKGLVDKERRKKKREMMTAVVAIWQDRWDSSQDGRDLYKFFPDITERLIFRWVEPDYAVSQILVGHGCFNERLLKFSLRNSGLCPCGSALESRDHALWDCDLYVEERNTLLDSIQRTAIGPVYFRDLVCCESNFKELRRFAHAWHHKRKQYED